MAEKIKLDIVTPYGEVFSDEVDEVTAPGSEGEFGVLPGHAPFATTLKTGLLTAKKDGKSMYFFTNWGYAEAGPAKLVIMADSAEASDDIDIERAIEAKRKAEEQLRHEDEEQFAQAEASLERAIARIHIGQSLKGK